MEVLVGFAVGYWVGTRQGRQGLVRAVDAAQEIWASPETRRLLGEGLAAAAPVAELLGKGKRHRGLAVIRELIDELAERRYAHQEQAA